MRALAEFILGLLLIAGLANGAALHAVELSHAEVTQGTEFLHSPGDHDEVPADADKNYPHHHNQCHGHDIAAPMKACAVALPVKAPASLAPAPMAARAAQPADRMLRPPIA